ncbi:calreticulin-3 [Arapaima gigas]
MWVTRLFIVVFVAAFTADAIVYFKEEFLDGDAYKSRWVESKHKSDYGYWKLNAGMFYGDAEKDKGLQTSQDARFYALSTRFEPFSNEGPDVCGYSTKKVHVIFNYKGKNHLIKKDVKCKDDELTHLYTLILRPDQTYEVKIDNEKVESGSLEDDWDFLPPKKIKDPEAIKPEDWDDRAKIDDVTDTRPEDWDKPENIPDPDAKKPDDWDEEMDGEWEPPMIPNSEYKGEWKPRQIDNPNYKGVWVHPEIDNPEYSPDPSIYKFDNIGVLGLDLWQVKSGTIFDNFIITDDEKTAEDFAKETWGLTKEPEKKMKEQIDEEERKLREEDKEEEVNGEEEDEEDDDDDDDEDDEEEEGTEGGEDNEISAKDEL